MVVVSLVLDQMGAVRVIQVTAVVTVFDCSVVVGSLMLDQLGEVSSGQLTGVLHSLFDSSVVGVMLSLIEEVSSR